MKTLELEIPVQQNGENSLGGDWAIVQKRNVIKHLNQSITWDPREVSSFNVGHSLLTSPVGSLFLEQE